MAFNAGYWPNDYFVEDYWQIGEQYWGEYGEAAPEEPSTASGNFQDEELMLSLAQLRDDDEVIIAWHVNQEDL